MAMSFQVLVILLFGMICFCSGQNKNENGTTGSCSLWYYDMPRSIECQPGTHFYTACQVKVPCNIETEIDWYWSPLNMPNKKTLPIINSASNGTRIRALLTSNAKCSPNTSTPVKHLSTLSLTKLNLNHAGYYWCQLRVVNYRGTNPVGELLPSNQGYVGVKDMAENCEYGEHSDKWMCAQKKVTNSNGQNSLSLRPTLHITASYSASPTVGDGGPSDNSRDPFIKMSLTLLEIVFLVVIVICLVIIALLFGCLFRKHRRRKEGATVVAASQNNLQKQRRTATPEDPTPRYTPVNTLNHALFLPQLATDWWRHRSCDAAYGADEEPVYSSPYQHLSLDNLDYTNMYSKPH